VMSAFPLVQGAPPPARHSSARLAVARTAGASNRRASDRGASTSGHGHPRAAGPRAHAAQTTAAPAGPRDQQNAQPAAQPLSATETAFEQCVAWRESTDTPTDPDGLFGILPSTWAELGYAGTAGQAPVWLQKVAFNRLYQEDGVQPWAPSDGC
jgi:hypothetical protein